jgi:hypothetical protein
MLRDEGIKVKVLKLMLMILKLRFCLLRWHRIL